MKRLHETLKNNQLVLLIFLSFFIMHISLCSGLGAPIIYADDAGYIGNARSFLYGYGFPISHLHIFYPGYSFLLMPAFLISNNFDIAYRVIQVINSLIMSFIPVLIYLITPAFKGNIEIRDRFIITVLISLYPTYLLYSYYVHADLLLITLYLLLVYLVYKLTKNSTSKFLWFSTAVTAVYIWMTSPRAVALFPALFLVLAILIFKDRKYKGLIIFLGIFIPGYILLQLLLKYIDAQFLMSRFGERLEFDPYQLSTLIKYYLNFDHIKGIAIQALGQFMYLIFSTYGFFLFGIFYAFYLLKDKELRKDRRYLVLIFVLLSFIFTFMLSCFFIRCIYRPTQYFYGRYNDIVLIPLFILGIIGFKDKFFNWKIISAYITVCVALILMTNFTVMDIIHKFPINFNAARSIFGMSNFKIFLFEFNFVLYSLYFILVSIMIILIRRYNKNYSLIVLICIFLFNGLYINNILLKQGSEVMLLRKNLIPIIKEFGTRSDKFIVEYDDRYNLFSHIEDEKFCSEQTKFANEYSIINTIYNYQVRIPKMRIHILDTNKPEKPVSDLILSSNRNLDKIYKGAKIINKEIFSLPLYLWIMPGKNQDYFINKYKYEELPEKNQYVSRNL